MSKAKNVLGTVGRLVATSEQDAALHQLERIKKSSSQEKPAQIKSRLQRFTFEEP